MMRGEKDVIDYVSGRASPLRLPESNPLQYFFESEESRPVISAPRRGIRREGRMLESSRRYGPDPREEAERFLEENTPEMPEYRGVRHIQHPYEAAFYQTAKSGVRTAKRVGKSEIRGYLKRKRSEKAYKEKLKYKSMQKELEKSKRESEESRKKGEYDRKSEGIKAEKEAKEKRIEEAKEKYRKERESEEKTKKRPGLSVEYGKVPEKTGESIGVKR